MNYTSNSFFVFLIFFVGFLSAQSPCRDSILKKLKADSLRIYKTKKILPYFSFDNRLTKIGNTRCDISGFKLGVNFKEHYVFGFGIYSLVSPEKEILPKTPASDTLSLNIRLSYITLFYHHILLRKKFIEFHLPIEFGAGNAFYTKKFRNDNQLFNRTSHFILPYGAGLKTVLKPVPHFGFFLFIGIRIVPGSNRFDVPLSGGFSALGLYLNLLKINRDLRYYLFKKHKAKKSLLYCNYK